jgi:hypothetical protein
VNRQQQSEAMITPSSFSIDEGLDDGVSPVRQVVVRDRFDRSIGRSVDRSMCDLN